MRADLAQRQGTAPPVPQNDSFVQGPGGGDTAHGPRQALTCPGLPHTDSAIKSAVGWMLQPFPSPPGSPRGGGVRCVLGGAWHKGLGCSWEPSWWGLERGSKDQEEGRGGSAPEVGAQLQGNPAFSTAPFRLIGTNLPRRSHRTGPPCTVFKLRSPLAQPAVPRCFPSPFSLSFLTSASPTKGGPGPTRQVACLGGKWGGLGPGFVRAVDGMAVWGSGYASGGVGVLTRGCLQQGWPPFTFNLETSA